LESLPILQKKFSEERCLVHRMDVTQPEEASDTLQALIGQLGDVQFIILNAGVGHLNPDLDWKLEEEVIKTNVLGFTALACTGTKYFEQRGEGQLVGISSKPEENAGHAYLKIRGRVQGLRPEKWPNSGGVLQTTPREGRPPRGVRSVF
jgi:NADP-dependent 3-hydroxy acid dehydrogenase YdfG